MNHDDTTDAMLTERLGQVRLDPVAIMTAYLHRLCPKIDRQTAPLSAYCD
jgi:hypothetical protein